MRKGYIFGLWTVSFMVVLATTSVFHADIAEAQLSEEGLIIYYSFEKDSIKNDDVIDQSGNGNDGFLKGNLKSVKGKVGEGMEFPGIATDYIAVRNHRYEKADIEAMTLAAWVKVGTRSMIASWDRSEFFRFTVGDDQLGNNDFLAFDTCCGIHDWHGKTKLTDDKWHHVVGVFDGKAKQKRAYVDGKLDAEVAATHAVMGKAITRYGFLGVGSEAAAFDGGTGPTAFPFNGVMDEFFLFHRAITEKEVELLAQGRGFAVKPVGKLSLTWGEIKASR